MIFLLFGKSLEPAGGIYPHVVPEIVLIEIGEVDGDDIGDGMVTQRSLAGKAGDAMCRQPVIFDVGPCRDIGQPEHIRRAADAEVQGQIADDAGEA